MYIVTLQNASEKLTIHGEGDKLSVGKIAKGINTIDSFQFTMLPSNIGFDKVYDYTTLVSVYNTNKDRYDFFGRVLYCTDGMDESGLVTKEVICESYMGFLCDSQQEYVKEQNWTVGGLLQHIINKHNSQVEGYKQFTIGEVTVTDPNDNVYCGIARENTWESLNSNLIDILGGEFRFRVVGEKIYIDYLKEIGTTSSTSIELSRNMKSIVKEKDPSEIVTRVIPLGCKLTAEVEDEEGNVTKEETEYRLDISSINGGKNYIDDEVAQSIYGIRVATVEFDDVTVVSTLLARGEEWLAENNKVRVGYTITALDLSLIGLDHDDFDICNYHVIKNPLLGINDTARIIKKTIDICDETKSTIEFGDNSETLTQTMKRQSNSLKLISANYVTNQKFSSVINQTATAINQTEESIRLEVMALDDRLNATNAALSLKIGRNENDQIVSMLNASADEIFIESNRLVINSTYFTLLNDGTVTARKINITGGEFELLLSGGEYVRMGSLYSGLCVDSADYTAYTGTRVQILPQTISYINNGQGVIAIWFGGGGSIASHVMNGDWSISGSLQVLHGLTIGTTPISESQLAQLLALI